MPFSLARSAISLPISLAAAIFPPDFAAAKIRLGSRSRSQRHPVRVIDYLGIDVIHTAEDCEARALGRARNLFTNPFMNCAPDLLTIFFRHLYLPQSLIGPDYPAPHFSNYQRLLTVSITYESRLLTGLSGFELQLLVCITNALAFVGVGLSQASHIGGDLAYLLAVDARNGQSRLILLNRLVDALDLIVDPRGIGNSMGCE